jgi:Protein of unknown function (DUF3179)
MATDPGPRRVRRRRALLPAALLLLCLAGAAALTTLGLLRPGRAVPPPEDEPPAVPPPKGAGPPPAVLRAPPDLMDLPGVDRPPVRPAAEAGLGDDAEVIGVLAGGRPRAYLVDALSQGPRSHVVNDVLGGVPVSVTHCDVYQCTRVFTGQGADPLALRQGGLHRGGMLLRWGGLPYSQETQAPLYPKSPAFPYRPHPYEATTWGAWRRAHPDTDVYLGPSGEPRRP